MDIKSDVAKVETDVKAVEADVKVVDSWLKANWHYALAIGVGAIFLGAAVGIKIGEHLVK